VHALLSLHDPLVRGVDAHELVPLQESVVQTFGSLVHVRVVPLQLPAPSHKSV
jgi:hypothetical protein